MPTKTLTKLLSSSGQMLRNQDWSNTFTKNFLSRSRSVDPDVLSIKSRALNSLPISSSLLKLDTITAHGFSTSSKKVQLNSEAIPNKLVTQASLPQTPVKFFTRRAEEETIEVEGVGWAGQPIVKRLHTILPEVHGDKPDVLQATKRSRVITEVGNNLEVKVRNFGRSHDIIAAINENARNRINQNSTVNKTGSRILHTKKPNIYSRFSGISNHNPTKVKRKKRTVVLASKPAAVKRSKKYKKQKAKGERTLIVNSYKFQPSMVLNRQLSTVPLLSSDFKSVSHRQFQTFSAMLNSKAAVAAKAEKKVSKLSVTGQSKRGKASKVAVEPKFPEDDCVCPEILYTTGKRKSTKICGEAEGASKAKKKSSWKQKMCLVEPKEDQGRKKTYVCLSEAAKQGKRKKELPKCPEPEVKIAPRVVICKPNLEEEESKKAKKECVKIEEVKIRKRTQVCKPVVIFAKEEVGVKVEKKAVCASSRIKVVSRHTKICPPTDDKKLKKQKK